MKKIISLSIAIILLACIFTSCANNSNDLLEISRTFVEKDYWVEISVTDDNIQDLADTLDIKSNGIECVMVVSPDDGDDEEKGGIFVFFKDAKTAQNAEKDLKNFIEEDDNYVVEDIIRCVVKRTNNLVFFGSEYAWDDRKSF